MFKTDMHGIAFKCDDAKLTVGSSTWGMRLSQLARQDGIVRIITYSLPDMRYVREQLGRRPTDMYLVANSKFIERAWEIKREFPNIRVAHKDNVHSKVCLIEPHTIIISSANFGNSHKWHETTVSFHSKDAHDWYVDAYESLWSGSQELELSK